MKTWIYMLILTIAATGLIVWDGIHTNKVFDHMKAESANIHSELITKSIEDEEIKNKINSLNTYWTKEMDALCISISRKDLQPVSDYLQYLRGAVINKSQEDAITYSLLLDYNIEGLKETTGISGINLL